MLLDTSGVGARAYTFAATPRGVRYQSSSESSRFRPAWSALAVPTAEGWNAELVIPLDALRAEPGAKQSWRINFVRHVAATNEDYTWAYDPAASAPTDATYWPLLANIRLTARATRPKPRADLYALGSAGADRRQFQTAAGDFQPQQPRSFGLDATVPFTNTLAFVGALNPDFSNVEVDQETIAPQEFRRGLTEYRPFFAQGANYLEPFGHISVNGPPDVPFYTPAIGTFDRGLKIEGSAGTQSIGALSVRGPGFDDQAFAYGLTAPDQSRGFAASAVLAHHDTGDDMTASVGFNRRNIRSGEGTMVLQRFESGTFVGDARLARALDVTESLVNSRMFAFAGYRDVGPQYAPIDGYTRASDVRGPQALFQYNGVGGGAVKAFSLTAFGDRLLDRSGAVHQADALAQAAVTFKGLLTVSAGPSTSELRTYDAPYPLYTDPRTYRFDQHSAALGYRDGTATPVDASFSWGPFAAFCPGAPRRPRSAARGPGSCRRTCSSTRSRPRARSGATPPAWTTTGPASGPARAAPTARSCAASP